MVNHQNVKRINKLPRVSLRDPHFVRKVLAGVQGPFVDNVVTNCTLSTQHDVMEHKQTFDISRLAWQLGGKHDPKQFKASTSIRLFGDPSGTYLMFPSECMVMTGVRCPELVLKAALCVTRFYSERYGRICHLRSYQGNNVHGVINMKHPLDLETMHSLMGNSYYRATAIKCVIFKIPVPLREPPVVPTPPMGHLLWPTPVPDYGPDVVWERQQQLEKDIAAVEAESIKKAKAAKAKAKVNPNKRKRAAMMEAAVVGSEIQAEEMLGDIDANASAVVPPPSAYRPVIGRAVYTTASLEAKTPAAKRPKLAPNHRKKAKDPTEVAVNVWQSGKVGLLGRNEQHLVDAAFLLAPFFAQFTMRTSSTS